MQPPIAKRIPVVRELHGERFVDDYAWLRDRSDPDVIAHLEAENAYTEHATAHLAGLRTEIFEEIRSRTLETDLSAPVRRGDHWYASRTEEGMQYPVHVRMVGSPDGPEEVLLDVNALAAGHDFMAIGVFVVSPDGTRLAYSTDTDGSERFTLRIRDIASGEDLDDVVERSARTPGGGTSWERSRMPTSSPSTSQTSACSCPSAARWMIDTCW
jgi:oligopeptidase B